MAPLRAAKLLQNTLAYVASSRVYPTRALSCGGGSWRKRFSWCAHAHAGTQRHADGFSLLLDPRPCLLTRVLATAQHWFWRVQLSRAPDRVLAGEWRRDAAGAACALDLCRRLSLRSLRCMRACHHAASNSISYLSRAGRPRWSVFLSLNARYLELRVVDHPQRLARRGPFGYCSSRVPVFGSERGCPRELYRAFGAAGRKRLLPSPQHVGSSRCSRPCIGEGSLCWTSLYRDREQDREA